MKGSKEECDQQEQEAIAYNQDSSLKSKQKKSLAPKAATLIDNDNQQELLVERLKNENNHLKSLSKENEETISELESTIKIQQDNIAKLENRLKSENQRENIDKLLSISIGILSEFATKAYI